MRERGASRSCSVGTLEYAGVVGSTCCASRVQLAEPRAIVAILLSQSNRNPFTSRVHRLNLIHYDNEVDNSPPGLATAGSNSSKAAPVSPLDIPPSTCSIYLAGSICSKAGIGTFKSLGCVGLRSHVQVWAYHFWRAIMLLPFLLRLLGRSNLLMHGI